VFKCPPNDTYSGIFKHSFGVKKFVVCNKQLRQIAFATEYKRHSEFILERAHCPMFAKDLFVLLLEAYGIIFHVEFYVGKNGLNDSASIE